MPTDHQRAGLWARLVMLGNPTRGPQEAPRIALERQPERVYAIGDVHGCLDLLTELEAKIKEDAADEPGESLIVMLGDLIDRGPQSAQVIEHVMAEPPDRFKRICLRGNHEAMMLEFIAGPGGNTIWLENGGRETLQSYGVPTEVLAPGVAPAVLARVVARAVSPAHVQFLSSLPVLLETPQTIFVHAGLRPGRALKRQSDLDLIWIRDDYNNTYEEFARTVVHGHMPRSEALVSSFRIGIDTGGFSSGRLTAVRIMPGFAPKLLSVSRDGL